MSGDGSSTDYQLPKKYLIGLMALLCIATFCEGYDFFIISLVLKKLSIESGRGIRDVIYTLSIVNGGAILGFFVIRLGDKVGRKPILVLGIAGYAGLSLVTAMIPDGSPNLLVYYCVVQFIAKTFLVTEFGTAIIMVTEEYPAKVRGTAVAILEVAGAVGGGAAMFAGGRIIPHFGWRYMYWIGGAPLVLIPILLLFVKETQHYKAMKAGDAGPQPSLMEIWKSKSAKFILPVGAIWFLGYLSYAGVIYFWPLFAEEERGWSLDMIGPKLVIASAVGMSGYVISGVMMDVLGRKITGAIFYLASAASLLWAFTAHGAWMIPSIVAAMFFIFAQLPINSTYNAELFPTRHRSSSTAWCNSLIGRPAQVIAPFIVGTLEKGMGLGNAVCILAVGPLIAMFVIIFILPETKGIKMDKV